MREIFQGGMGRQVTAYLRIKLSGTGTVRCTLSPNRGFKLPRRCWTHDNAADDTDTHRAPVFDDA